MIRKKGVIILDHWCGEEYRGTSAGCVQLEKPIKHADIADIDVIYYDDIRNQFGNGWQDVVVDMVGNSYCDFIVTCTLAISLPMLQEMKRRTSAPIIHCMLDSASLHNCDLYNQLDLASDKYIALDTFSGYTTFPVTNRDKWCFDPLNQYNELLSDPNAYRDYDVTLIGWFKPEREQLIKDLAVQGVSVIHLGGKQFGAGLSNEDYARAYQRSKISIDHSLVDNNNGIIVPQVKGRIWETLLCGALLMENNTELISMFLQPGVHFVGYDSADDLAEKIKYYLSHSVEWEKIRIAGRERAIELCNCKTFWIRHLRDVGIDI